jgi:hypothetical protein
MQRIAVEERDNGSDASEQTKAAYHGSPSPFAELCFRSVFLLKISTGFLRSLLLTRTLPFEKLILYRSKNSFFEPFLLHTLP